MPINLVISASNYKISIDDYIISDTNYKIAGVD